MDVLRTPDAAFADIGFDFEAHYLSVKAQDGSDLRMHYIDEGPKSGPVVLCLHGQPSWSFLYRKMVAPLTAAGLRVIAPDLISFGKSDKPTRTDAYSYGGHVDWMVQFIEQLNLRGINGLFQDWGGLIGMRVVERMSERFARVVVANTMLLDTADIPDETAQALEAAYNGMPVPSAKDIKSGFDNDNPLAGAMWVKYVTENPAFDIKDVFKVITGVDDESALAGYAAPFPDDSLLAGPRALPQLFQMATR